MRLLIGNKNYSSWSLRPWLVLKHFNITFDEELLLLNGEGWKQHMIERTPTGRVPVLEHKGLAIPETIAIIEYLADLHPELAIWPEDIADRAQARAISAEMHAGFTALRDAAPMNLRADLPGRVAAEEVADDLERLETSLAGLLAESGGPFLFGDFTAADAMYAPVAARLRTYHLPVSETLETWIEAIYALPAFQAWYGAAIVEPWTVPQDEVDMMHETE